MSVQFQLQQLGFSPTFYCRANPDIRSGERLFRFPAGPARELVGPRVAVVPYADAEAWIGHFAGGVGDLTGLYCGPTSDQLCVVANGEGYLVEVFNPPKYERVQLVRVQQVWRVPGADALCIIGDTDIALYGRRGLIWAARGIAADALRVTSVTAEHITGDIVDDGSVIDKFFVVDARTGEWRVSSVPF
ncbi:MAG TPA: hypothetical protein VNW46_18340 [Gemmatimonadaceae bacterium]|jgi:hypothetical protein|nr:hypothetical protein [Gemmatimonadaceae bacterium]